MNFHLLSEAFRMSTTTNGRERKSLAEQIDRLDGILDGLAQGLEQAVVAAVQAAVGLAVRESCLPRVLAVGVGTTVGIGAYFAGPCVAAAVGWLAGFAASLALQAWAALRRTLGAPGVGIL
jgi:hypothetical protein